MNAAVMSALFFLKSQRKKSLLVWFKGTKVSNKSTLKYSKANMVLKNKLLYSIEPFYCCGIIFAIGIFIAAVCNAL